MHPYRVFISYSHEDEKLIRTVSQIMREIGLHPTFDVGVRPGDDFLENIKGLITRAHLFVAVVTANSQNCAWLHQETGFAIALRVPVLTLVVGADIPAGMIAHVQAVKLSADPDALRMQIRQIPFEGIVSPNQTRNVAPIEVVDWPERRSEVIASHANWLWQFEQPCRVRHRGPLTSFSIPDAPLEDAVWDQCGDGVRGSEYLRHLLREERRALERHARAAGCSLIVNPAMVLDEKFIGSLRLRLSTLIAFLESMPDNKVTAVMVSSSVEGSMILVGDHFFASSHAPRKGGYRQTVINWHAQSVLGELKIFDEQVEKALASAEIAPEQSRAHLLDRLREHVALL